MVTDHHNVLEASLWDMKILLEHINNSHPGLYTSMFSHDHASWLQPKTAWNRIVWAQERCPAEVLLLLKLKVWKGVLTNISSWNNWHKERCHLAKALAPTTPPVPFECHIHYHGNLHVIIIILHEKGKIRYIFYTKPQGSHPSSRHGLPHFRGHSSRTVHVSGKGDGSWILWAVGRIAQR